jgi:hypothetical protein
MKKVTYTFDDETVATIREAAGRSRRPQSAIVREAVAAYHVPQDRLTDEQRARMLQVFDTLVGRMPTRSGAAVDRELKALRASRRAAGLRRRNRAKAAPAR